jgi:hypothetical protein
MKERLAVLMSKDEWRSRVCGEIVEPENSRIKNIT